MKFTESLTSNRDFKRLYARGKSAASPLLVAYCRKNGTERNRLGLTVSTKVGKAVHRNGIRRRLREIYRLGEERVRRGFDIVVVARVRCRHAAYRELEEELWRLFSVLGLTRGEDE